MTSPVSPPADDQVREAAVEAVAMWIGDNDTELGPWAHSLTIGWGDVRRGSWRAMAEELLSLPAVSALVDKARADELDQAATWLNKEPSQGGAPFEVNGDRFDTDGGDFIEGAVWAVQSLRSRATSIRAAIRQTEGNNR